MFLTVLAEPGVAAGTLPEIFGSFVAVLRTGQMSLPQRRIPYHALTSRDQFATIYRVARWLRGAVDWSAVDAKDAELFLSRVWGPLTRENPAERSISAEGLDHLNKMAAVHLPLDLNRRYHLSRLHVAGESDRLEFSCLQIQPPQLTLAIARVPRRHSRVRQITVVFDERGGVVRLRPDPTKGLRRLAADSEALAASIQEFVRHALEIDRRCRELG
jgi:hypothetical protein